MALGTTPPLKSALRGSTALVGHPSVPRPVRPALETPDPPGVVGSYGEQVRRWSLRRLRLELDPWQAYALDKALRHDRNGDLIHRIALISTGRQSGKSIIVRMFTGWMLDNGWKLPPFRGWTTLLAAAHDAKQARVLYGGVFKDMESTPDLRASVHATRYFGIRSRSHNIDLDTVTHIAGSARGKSAGAILWDEILTQTNFDMYEALAPTQSAQRSPIMLMTSTAGHAQSVVLRAFYNRLTAIVAGTQEPDPTFYGAWWMASDDDVELDWDELRKANPALGDGRLSKAAITTEYHILPKASWIRERLNRWADDRAEPPFSMYAWGQGREPDPLKSAPGPFVLAIDCDSYLTEATIAVGGVRQDGRVGVEIYRHISGTASDPITGTHIETLVSNFRGEIKSIMYPATSALAPALVRAQMKSQLPFEPLQSPDMVRACQDLAEGVGARRIVHNDPFLDAEISGAERRMIGKDGGWRWSITASQTPITSVVAATLAFSGASRAPRAPQFFFPGGPKVESVHN